MDRTWVVDEVYVLLGAPVRIRTDESAVGARIEKLFAPFAPGGPDAPVPEENVFALLDGVDGSQRQLLRGSSTILRTPDWPRILERLVSELNDTALRAFAGLAAHAGVVALETGAVAFPAPSGGGKSTLSAACVQAGFVYVSDEALCLDLGTGRVVPYPKPCGLTSASRDLLGIPLPQPASLAGGQEAMLTAEELGGRAASGEVELREVVLAERGDAQTLLEPLAAAEVVTSVLRHSFNHYKRPEQSFRLMVELAQRCRAWRMVYRQPSEVPALLREALS